MLIKISAGVDYHLLYKPNCMITFLKHMLLWLTTTPEKNIV